MTPIWAKDVNGKWAIFPTHLVETLDDGSKGFRFYWVVDTPEKRKYFSQFRDCFEDSPVDSLRSAIIFYRLRKQPVNE